MWPDGFKADDTLIEYYLCYYLCLDLLQVSYGFTAANGQKTQTIYPGFSVDLEIMISPKIWTYYLREMVDIS